MSFITRTARHGLSLGATFLALGVTIQLLLSWTMMMYSTSGVLWTCERCGRVVRGGDGLIVSPRSLHRLHWFRLTTERVVAPGKPSCAHRWQEKRLLIFRPLPPVVYPVALVLSVGCFALSVASTLCYFLWRRRTHDRRFDRRVRRRTLVVLACVLVGLAVVGGMLVCVLKPVGEPTVVPTENPIRPRL